MSKTISVLASLDELARGSKLALFGAGETGQEFVRTLRSKRPDVTVTCFFDSFREGESAGIPVVNPSRIPALERDVNLVVTSVFWNEIGDIIETRYPREYRILSNDLINRSSHLSSFGSFYFESSAAKGVEARLERLMDKFRTDLDRQILRKLCDLRVGRREKDFFTFVDDLTPRQSKSFGTRDKYSQKLNLDGVRYVIEGGVYDGEDTFRLLEVLSRSIEFERIDAFDPSLNALHRGPYMQRIDSRRCTFHESVLWDRDEKVGFRADEANPANSRVVREAEIGGGSGDVMHTGITIDTFVEQSGNRLDLIKLDVEGSEMNVLHGAAKAIRQWRPKHALSLYHRREHFLEIPEFLLECHSDYRFSLSVNNPSFVDMVVYAD
jgi:FkbM family methyltransferase